MSSNRKYTVETLIEENKTEELTVKSTDTAVLDQPKVAYKDIYDLKNLKLGLKRIKNSVSPGLDNELKKDITETQLIAIQKSLRKQSYKAKPIKRINIAKPNGGVRLLGIACTNDKIIQSTLLLLLEPILEKIFLDHSHGFRPKRGCHTALKEIKFK
jgi:retron-type reverse transcriptase